MPWSDDDQALAERLVLDGLEGRPDADRDPRVVASMALENVGNNRHPQGPTLTGDRLRRKLTSGKYDRWATVVWRAELAAQAGRSAARLQRWKDGTP